MLRAVGATFRQVPLRTLVRAASGQPEKRLPTLTLFTKINNPCALCDEAKKILSKYYNDFEYEEKYIDHPANEDWHKLYKNDVPVIHLNGHLFMKHRVDEEKLKAALEELKGK